MPFDGNETAVSVSQCLRDARELVRQDWCRGAIVMRLTVSRLAYCSVGAVQAAAGCVSRPSPISERALSYLGMVLGAAPYAPLTASFVASWNDAAERSQTEVVALFDHAIALADKVD